MDVRTMKHAAKLAEWSEKVQACRSSGLPVKEWCEQNNICPKTYYAWERVYLAEVSKQLVIPEPLSAARSSQIVRVDPSQMPDEVEVIGAAPAVQPTSNVQITLRYGAMSVEISLPARPGRRISTTISQGQIAAPRTNTTRPTITSPSCLAPFGMRRSVS